MKQTLKYIYSVVYDNLKFAESKHSIVLTLAGIVLAFATTLFTSNVIENLLTIASILFALIAIFYSFVALVARTVRLKKRGNTTGANLIYYKHIMHFDEKLYIEQLRQDYSFTKIYKPDKMDYDLAKQIISVSKLAHIKFLYFNFAVMFLIASIVCLIANVVLKGQIL